MRLVYLPTAEPGLRWMRHYYRQNPQLSFSTALASLKRAEDRLREYAPSGKTFENFEAVWEQKIQNTAFSILYTIREDTVFVIDIRDQRGFRSAPALARHAQLIRQRYGL